MHCFYYFPYFNLLKYSLRVLKHLKLKKTNLETPTMDFVMRKYKLQILQLNKNLNDQDLLSPLVLQNTIPLKTKRSLLDLLFRVQQKINLVIQYHRKTKKHLPDFQSPVPLKLAPVFQQETTKAPKLLPRNQLIHPMILRHRKIVH